MTTNDIERQARELITDRIAAGEVVQMHWAVQELINNQGEIIGDGVPFFTLCAKEHIYRVVKKVVDKYDKPTEDGDRQLTLKGYECLQEAYTVERDEERQLVPVSLISDDELIARAREYRVQAEALVKHADEIELFVSERKAKRQLEFA
jgi:hypothetical protein